jgi:hypothetical protein
MRFDPKQMAQRRVKELKTALKLSSSQEKKILAIFLKQGKEMQAFMKSHRPSGPRPGGPRPGGQGGPPSGDWQKMRKQMEAMRAKTDKAVNAVLTPAQRKQYKAWEAQHRRFGGPGRPGGPGGPGGPPPQRSR